MAEQLGVAAVNWVTRITQRLAPWALGVIVFGLCALSPGVPPVITISEGYSDSSRAPFVVILLMAAMCGLAAGYARRSIWLLLIVTMIAWGFFTAYPAVMVTCYYAAIQLTRRVHAVAFLIGATAGVTVPVMLGFAIADDDLGTGIFVAAVELSMIVVLPYAIGLWVNARRQVIAGLHDRAARLELEHAARADQARGEERARIAREMHDVVAHRVALMVLHAGALEVNAPDERLAGEAALIRTTGREALTELRQVLGVLRAQQPDAVLAPQPDLSDLDRLIEQTRAAGLALTLTRDGAERPLPLMVQRTAYRVVQEALTNVVKHAGGAQTVVSLRYLNNTLEIKVENGPPQGPVDRMPGSGLGLIGLRERIALLYGRLETRPRLDGGFLLTAVLPLDASEVPA